MGFNRLVRQFHRWVAIAFTLGVLVNTVIIVGLKQDHPPSWIYLLALIPLFALLGSGLYMFVAPYFTERRTTAPATR